MVVDPVLEHAAQADGTVPLVGRDLRLGDRRGHTRCAQLLGVDVDHQGQQQDQAADQDLEEAVDVDVVEAVVEHAQDEQAEDGVADAAAAAEQAGAADHHGRDRIEQVVVELVLLGAAEIGDAQHAGDAGADGRDHHDRGDHQLDVDAGIFGRLAVAADHVHVAAEAGVGQDQVARRAGTGRPRPRPPGTGRRCPSPAS